MREMEERKIMKKVKKNTEKIEITKKNENERMMREQKDD
jgi:hypothetical protein